MTFSDDPTQNPSDQSSSAPRDDAPKADAAPKARKPRATKAAAPVAESAGAETAAEKPAAKRAPRKAKSVVAEASPQAEASFEPPAAAAAPSSSGPAHEAEEPRRPVFVRDDGTQSPERTSGEPDGERRPRFDRAPRPRMDRAPAGRGDRGDRPRFNRDDRPRDDRPRFDRPRDDRPRDDRPREDRPRDDRPRFDRPRDDRPRDDRPRDDRPREDRPRFDRPRDDRPRDDRPREDRPRFDRPRDDRPRDDRPRFDRDERPRFNRDGRPRFDRPRDDRPSDDRPRDDRPRDDRPRFERDDRPRFNRDDRPRDDRPRFDREERPAFNRDDRPRDDRPRDDRPRDDRPRFDREERPRFNRDDRPREDRPRDDRPREERPRFDRDERPRFEREERPRFERDERPREDRPREDRPRDERPREDRPRFDRGDRPRPERSERPRFQRDGQSASDATPASAKSKPARPVWNQPGVFVSEMPKKAPDAEERPEANVATKAAEAYKSLMNLVVEVGSEYGLTRSEDFQVDEFLVPARLQMRATAAAEQSVTGPEALLKDLRDRIAEAVVAHKEFRMGAVYCFQCDSAGCSHAFPEHAGDTFSGYTATGKPEWKGFANIFLENRDERVEKVYGDKPEVVALVQSAAELKGDLLPGFGRESMVYNVLGQVVIGLVPVDFRLHSTDSPRTAITLQVVETRSLSARHRLRLNMLGLSVDQLAKASESSKGRTAAVRLQNVLRDVRTQLEALSRHVDQLERRGETVEPETWVAPLLRRLQGDLEKTLRTSPVRTQHAEERHLEGERPTAVALRDASKASLDKYYIDVRHETTVVLGPRLRAHVFGRDGVHVTSMQLESGELERKMGKGFWVQAPGDQAVVLQAAIRAKMGE